MPVTIPQFVYNTKKVSLTSLRGNTRKLTHTNLLKKLNLYIEMFICQQKIQYNIRTYYFT